MLARVFRNLSEPNMKEGGEQNEPVAESVRSALWRAPRSAKHARRLSANQRLIRYTNAGGETLQLIQRADIGLGGGH